MIELPAGFRALDAALVHGVHIYPYSERGNTEPTHIVSPDGRPWSGDQPRGVDYWKLLHGIHQSEVVDEGTASTSRC